MNAGDRRMAEAEWRSRLPAARMALAQYPSVVGVGVGPASDGGPDRAPAWRVYVMPDTETSRIPTELLGLSTSIIPATEGQPIAGATIYKAGMPISNKLDSDGGGSLGCFAKRGNEVVLLSAAHVLFAEANMSPVPQVDIYQPAYACCGGGAKIATTLQSWSDGFRAVAGSPGNFDTDCAIAKLAPGIQYNNSLDQIGMIAGTASPTPNMEVLDFTTVPQAAQMVRMVSNLSDGGGLRYGTIMHLLGPAAWPLSTGPFYDDANDALIGMKRTMNQFFIVPRLPPIDNETPQAYSARYAAFAGSGGRLSFSKRGDSGSVVVDNKPGAVNVIGLVSRKFPISLFKGIMPPNMVFPDILKVVDNFGIVNPIDNVLTQLNISIPANLSGTVPASGETARHYMPPAIAGIDGPAVVAAVESLHHRLKERRHGSLVVAKFNQHRAEASRLVNTVRNINATWIRYRGPAFANHCARSLREPAHAIPHSIDGMTFPELLEQMRSMLLRYGSPTLRRDIVRLGPFAIDLMTRVIGIHDLPDILTERKRELV